MTTMLGVFMEPHEWWGEYEERREEAYRRLIEGKTCLDCAKCVRSDRYPCGYCLEDGEMRYADDVPAEAGFECFADGRCA